MKLLIREEYRGYEIAVKAYYKHITGERPYVRVVGEYDESHIAETLNDHWHRTGGLYTRHNIKRPYFYKSRNPELWKNKVDNHAKYLYELAKEEIDDLMERKEIEDNMTDSLIRKMKG